MNHCSRPGCDLTLTMVSRGAFASDLVCICCDIVSAGPKGDRICNHKRGDHGEKEGSGSSEAEGDPGRKDQETA